MFGLCATLSIISATWKLRLAASVSRNEMGEMSTCRWSKKPPVSTMLEPTHGWKKFGAEPPPEGSVTAPDKVHASVQEGAMNPRALKLTRTRALALKADKLLLIVRGAQKDPRASGQSFAEAWMAEAGAIR
jgi:hypothetical protein